MVDRIDSNLTGLRYAEEVQGTPGILPGSPVWKPLDPNSYGDFGAQIATTTRDPISAGRQNRKGTITDLDASAGFQVDFTQEAMFDLVQGFMYADWRKKAEAFPTAVSSTLYTIGSGGAGFLVGSIVWASGFAVAGNNGLKAVSANTGTTVSVSGLATENSPPAVARITRVGHTGASGDITMSVSSGVASLLSTTLDFTTLGLIPGEWMFVGGDATSDKFATAANNGFYRIKSVAAHAIVFDRNPGTPVTDAGTSKTIKIFFGHVVKNESNPALIKVRTYQMERYLGDAAVGYEYVSGCYANQMDLTFGLASKISGDLKFIGLDRASQVSAKSGDRPSNLSEEVYNTTGDFVRLRLGKVSNQASLFTYVTDMKLTINNNVKPAKAIGVLGSIGANLGNFVVEGSVEAYFTDDTAVTAVRENDSCSLDFGIVKQNAGWYVDVPYLSLGDGRVKIAKDESIKLPLNLMATADPTLDHTLLLVCFRYLPDLAEPT